MRSNKIRGNYVPAGPYRISGTKIVFRRKFYASRNDIRSICHRRYGRCHYEMPAFFDPLAQSRNPCVIVANLRHEALKLLLGISYKSALTP